jgi:hypothetical protein
MEEREGEKGGRLVRPHSCFCYLKCCIASSVSGHSKANDKESEEGRVVRSLVHLWLALKPVFKATFV